VIMRAAVALLSFGILAAGTLTTGCDTALLDLASRAWPITPDKQADILTSRYLAGDYPGTINNTLDDPVVVYHFTYQNGVTLWALMLLYEQTGDADLLRQVQTSLAKYDRDRLYRPELGDDPIDYLGSMAHATLACSLITHDEQYLENALRAARFFHDDVARTPEDLIAYHSDPQRGRIWADALFMVTPLMAKAGRYLDDPTYYDDVLAQFRGFSQRLRDSDVGLYHQAGTGMAPAPPRAIGDAPTAGLDSR
jgi:rhamnogalacturonyl hydrolase YesR